MTVKDYKELSTSEKVILVEEIWDSIAEDKITLAKEQKDLLNQRLAAMKSTTKRTTWENIKQKVRGAKK